MAAKPGGRMLAAQAYVAAYPGASKRETAPRHRADEP